MLDAWAVGVCVPGSAALFLFEFKFGFGHVSCGTGEWTVGWRPMKNRDVDKTKTPV